MEEAKTESRLQMHWAIAFLGLVWAVAVLDALLPIDFNRFGLIPRTWSGAIGILSMPFLHGSWPHLIGNTVPLAVLLFLLVTSRKNSLGIVVGLILLGGSLLWLFGRSHIHIGASGVVYGLIGYLIASGLFERRLKSMIIAIVVGLLYGSTILWGIIPLGNKGISWDGHLASACAGVFIAYLGGIRDQKIRQELNPIHGMPDARS